MNESLLIICKLLFQVVQRLGLMQVLHHCFGEISGITSDHVCHCFLLRTFKIKREVCSCDLCVCVLRTSVFTFRNCTGPSA